MADSIVIALGTLTVTLVLAFSLTLVRMAGAHAPTPDGVDQPESEPLANDPDS
jgi:hypothetical protein